MQSAFTEATGLPPQLDLSDKDAPGNSSSPQENRYQLFINEANAFSQVVQIALNLKGLQNVVYVNVVRHEDGEHMEERACAECDISITRIRIKELAAMMSRLFRQQTFPVPLLYDMQNHAVVSTESDVIVRYLNTFHDLAEVEIDLCPQELQQDMDTVERKFLGKINKCIGRAATADNKDDFDTAAADLKQGLTALEELLGHRRYLCGEHITEADLYEFVALFRFDPLLSWAFAPDPSTTRGGNTGRLLISEHFPHIWGWLCDIYQMDGVAATCDLVEIANSKAYGQTFGLRIRELDIEFEDGWEESYLDSLMQPHCRGEEDEDVEEKEQEEGDQANEGPSRKKHRNQ